MIIKTELMGNGGNEFLKSIIGQMSDGIWECNSYMERFWNTCEITDDNCIEITDGHSYRSGYTLKSNGWYMKSKSYVVKFFAKRAYEIVDAFCDDNELCFRDEWKEYNNRVCNYFGYHEVFTIGDVKKYYLHLMFLYWELLKAER